MTVNRAVETALAEAELVLPCALCHRFACHCADGLLKRWPASSARLVWAEGLAANA
ncbi:MAG: hypothetical protein QOF18_920 [Frankiaceae bacterium]|nr:hypothetical protein [Frankiaceae bacterium]